MAKVGCYLDESRSDDEDNRHIFCPVGTGRTPHAMDLALCGYGSPASRRRSRSPICKECLQATREIAALAAKIQED